MKGTEKRKSRNLLRELLRLRAVSPVVYYTLGLLLVSELFAVFIAPAVIPEHYYLYAYLDEEARMTTLEFIRDENRFMVCGGPAGWSNRPDSSKEKWVIDGHGARTTHDVSTKSERERYVLFLGNSLTNGGTIVANDETISAYIEDESTESVNFATMMYSVDQSYIAYREGLKRFDADVVVVGISGRPTDGLFNQYVPFRYREERNMTCTKPRFRLSSGELELIPAPGRDVYASLFSSPELLERLSETDAYYEEFSAYKRLGFTPVSSGLHHLCKRSRGLYRSVNGEREGMELLKKIMEEFTAEAGRNGARILFMMLPDIAATAPGGWRRHLPDHYGLLVEELRGAGFNVFDARETIRNSGVDPWALYYMDGTHYSSEGNRVIAGGLKKAIEEALGRGGGGPTS